MNALNGAHAPRYGNGVNAARHGNGVNARRGEVAAIIDGNSYCLCLTLGALAQLENRLGLDNLSDLYERFAKATFSADDLIAIISAGLRGGGHIISDEEVSEMHMDGGFAGFLELVGELLNATFATPNDGEINGQIDEDVSSGEIGENPPKPQEANLSPGMK